MGLDINIVQEGTPVLLQGTITKLYPALKRDGQPAVTVRLRVPGGTTTVLIHASSDQIVVLGQPMVDTARLPLTHDCPECGHTTDTNAGPLCPDCERFERSSQMTTMLDQARVVVTEQFRTRLAVPPASAPTPAVCADCGQPCDRPGLDQCEDCHFVEWRREWHQQHAEPPTPPTPEVDFAALFASFGEDA